MGENGKFSGGCAPFLACPGILPIPFPQAGVGSGSAAALVVQGREIPYCDCPAEGFRKIRASRLEDADILAADQIIVRTNKMRQFFNEDCRRLLGRGGKPPAKGDKFVCLRNSSKRDAFNGQFFYAATAPRWNSFEQCWSCVLTDELLWNDGRDSLLADAYRYDERDIRGFCLGDVPLLDPKDPRLRLDYGYALTCHKAQGSEWDDVLIYDDGAAPGGEEMRRRWLYTAITRAKQRLTIVTP